MIQDNMVLRTVADPDTGAVRGVELVSCDDRIAIPTAWVNDVKSDRLGDAWVRFYWNPVSELICLRLLSGWTLRWRIGGTTNLGAFGNWRSEEYTYLHRTHGLPPVS